MSGARSEVPEPLLLFLDDDASYLAWYRQHFHGYVLNAEQTPSARYLILHKVPCRHLEGDVPWTTTDQCKICSPIKQSIDDWAMQKFGRYPDRCDTCQP